MQVSLMMVYDSFIKSMQECKNEQVADLVAYKTSLNILRGR